METSTEQRIPYARQAEPLSTVPSKLHPQNQPYEVVEVVDNRSTPNARTPLLKNLGFWGCVYQCFPFRRAYVLSFVIILPISLRSCFLLFRKRQ
jgi:hypothetical protein